MRIERDRRPRVACDSLVALGEASADGAVYFAKNSDRPARECQPLVLLPARRHAAGDRLRCQYIEIPQVERTLRILGSQPFWLWGLEHGVNEAGVAVGNHTVFTRDQPSGEKLIGMDLVRLALERAESAGAAVEVICELVERYGQGGSGYHDTDFPYHSSFMVADRRCAFLVETSDRQWARREVHATGSATNHLTIGSDWQEVSGAAVAHASERGWWKAGEGRFDFAAAYRDTSWVPPTFSSGRFRRTGEMLAASRIGEREMRQALRDHYDGTVFRAAYPPQDERYLSVCMHADPIGATTAATVIRLPGDGAALRYSACFGPPCVGVFVPLFIAGELPANMQNGSAAATSESLWWRFRHLLETVEEDLARRAPMVRNAWLDDEAEMLAQAEVLESADLDGAAATEFAERCAARISSRLDQIGRLLV